MTKEEFLALAEQRYDALQKLNKLDNFMITRSYL